MSQTRSTFARGEFSSLVSSFRQTGFVVHEPLPGVVQICRPDNDAGERLRLLISVGVHGDETAPIEMMALLLEELARNPQALALDLMVAVGNIDAIAQSKRFIDVDLNRLFTPPAPTGRTQFQGSREALRADQLMDVTARFFEGRPHKWHLDLHTAIRASFYPAFAIVPGSPNDLFLRWLGSAGIQAAVLNPDATVTFSAYTCRYLGAISCTAELGRIGELGKNDLTQFSQTQHALDALLRAGVAPDLLQSTLKPRLFRVAQELIKRSEAFHLTFDGHTQNFTEFAPHTLIARDGDFSYRVGDQPEYVLFPNPSVRVGLRAGLMAVSIPG